MDVNVFLLCLLLFFSFFGYNIVLDCMIARNINSLPVVERNGEGNGTPLQYSCLENPMGGGAW